MLGKKKLPRTIYVYQETDGGGAYLVAMTNLFDCTDRNETVRLVGTYHLIELGNVTPTYAYDKK